MKKLVARHGDVYIFEVDAVPKTAKKIKSKVLAEGEVTGHAHRLTADADVYEDTDGTLYLVPAAVSTIRHEEHTEIPVGDLLEEAGQSYVQREYNPYTKRAQEVKD